MAKSKEVIWWTLFAKGGVVSALFVPVLILITGFIIPFGFGGRLETFGPARSLLTYFLTRALLFVVISLSLFHSAHRIRHTIADLGVHGGAMLVATICYGGAIAGTGLAAWLVCTL
jgi:fumarate reductase subunit D